MDYYLDIRVLADLEISSQALLNNLFAKFHRASMALGRDRFAVSFPKYKTQLGDTLRVHGSDNDLNQLMESDWLKGLRDYCACSELAPVPSDCQYRWFRRVQRKSAHNKRKRAIAKGWLSEAEALAKFPDHDPVSRLPFIQLKSLSNQNIMRIYIERGPIVTQASLGAFNSYGLSAQATVPWF